MSRDVGVASNNSSTLKNSRPLVKDTLWLFLKPYKLQGEWPGLLWALSFVIYHNFRTPSARRPARNSFNCPTQNLVAISVRPSGLCGNFSLWLKPKEQKNSKIETFLPLRFSGSQGK